MTWLRLVGILEMLAGAVLLGLGLAWWRPEPVQLHAAFFGIFSVSAAWLMLGGIGALLTGVLCIAWGGRPQVPAEPAKA